MRFASLLLVALPITACAVSAGDSPPPQGDVAATTAQADSTAVYNWRANWSPLYGAMANDLAMVQTADNTLHIFGHGYNDGALYESHSDDGGSTWSAWFSGGAPGVLLKGTPAAVAPGGQDAYVFVRGTDNLIYMRKYASSYGGRTPGFQDVTDAQGKSVPFLRLSGRVFSADPVVSAASGGEIDVFMSTSDSTGGVNKMWRMYNRSDWSQGSQWSYQDLGGSVAAESRGGQAPYGASTTTTRGGGPNAIVMTDTNGALLSKECGSCLAGPACTCAPNDRLSCCDAAWKPLALPVHPASAPSVTYTPHGNTYPDLDVMVMGNDGAYYHSWYHHQSQGSQVGSWSAWDNAGGLGYTGSGVASAPTVIGWAGGSNDILALVQDRYMNYFWNHRDNALGKWDGWQPLPGSVCEQPGGHAVAITNWAYASGRINTALVQQDRSVIANYFDAQGFAQGSANGCACGGFMQPCCNGAVCQAGSFCDANNMCSMPR